MVGIIALVGLLIASVLFYRTGEVAEELKATRELWEAMQEDLADWSETRDKLLAYCVEVRKAVDAAAKRVGQKLDILNKQLSGRAFIVAEHPTIADVAVGTLMYRYFNLALPRPTLPHVEAWYERLKGRPAYQQHVMIDFKPMMVDGA